MGTFVIDKWYIILNCHDLSRETTGFFGFHIVLRQDYIFACDYTIAYDYMSVAHYTIASDYKSVAHVYPPAWALLRSPVHTATAAREARPAATLLSAS